MIWAVDMAVLGPSAKNSLAQSTNLAAFSRAGITEEDIVQYVAHHDAGESVTSVSAASPALRVTLPFRPCAARSDVWVPVVPVRVKNTRLCAASWGPSCTDAAGMVGGVKAWDATEVTLLSHRSLLLL